MPDVSLFLVCLTNIMLCCILNSMSWSCITAVMKILVLIFVWMFVFVCLNCVCIYSDPCHRSWQGHSGWGKGSQTGDWHNYCQSLCLHRMLTQGLTMLEVWQSSFINVCGQIAHLTIHDYPWLLCFYLSLSFNMYETLFTILNASNTWFHVLFHLHPVWMKFSEWW